MMPPQLEEASEKLMDIAERVGVVQDRHKVSAADAEKKLKFGLVEVVYEWAKGMVSDFQPNPWEKVECLAHSFGRR